MVSIPVETGVKDDLCRLADERGISVDTVVRELLARARCDERFAKLRKAMESNPPDDSYVAELRDWESEAWG
ncbi:hypothetical protein CYJ18_08710 [Actinomyces naeslundii]|uniref:Uncharacterized protein n=1 Tax=Actinomyces naeslundii TaxID=1655 RepID=A0AA47FH51_ACTNA|nr:hypothetical protein [Actinomyces naeslundii]OMG17007.1 hypothetical protein BKH04_06540 [Actinomyces naeslundii]PKY95062.1 hypothetical protein CYJ18_08710 [Actinomyces naeslundii]WAL42464.1 hypothetical protein OFA60_10445 [Actinomyces naeslundii]